MHGKYGLEFVSRRKIGHVTQLLLHAAEQEGEEFALDLWLRLYPFMTIGWTKFIPFADFRRQLMDTKPQHSDITPEEIEAEMGAVIAAYEKRSA